MKWGIVVERIEYTIIFWVIRCKFLKITYYTFHHKFHEPRKSVNKWRCTNRKFSSTISPNKYSKSPVFLLTVLTFDVFIVLHDCNHAEPIIFFLFTCLFYVFIPPKYSFTFIFGIESHKAPASPQIFYGAKDGLKLLTFLLLFSSCWHYRCALPQLVEIFFLL